jgi:hypothetical protein
MSDYCLPTEFLCEHTASRSRVFVHLTSLAGFRPDVLKAVLTCTDAELAERAAEVLNLVGQHPVCRTLAERIEAELPAAPAASFRAALDRAQARRWPIGDMGPARQRTAGLPGLTGTAGLTGPAGLTGLTGPANPGGPELPPFARLFQIEDHYCGDGCPPTYLTPRTADLLYAALTVLADEAYDDIAEFGDEPVGRGDGIEWSVFAMLPFPTWTESVDWRRKFARACDDLAGDLAAGRLPAPRCEAEHIALQLAVQDAPNYLPNRDGTGDPAHEALPATRWDYDWEGCIELLCTKRRLMLVYVAEPEGNDGATADAWFEWFPTAEPRDPDRGFRR